MKLLPPKLPRQNKRGAGEGKRLNCQIENNIQVTDFFVLLLEFNQISSDPFSGVHFTETLLEFFFFFVPSVKYFSPFWTKDNQVPGDASTKKGKKKVFPAINRNWISKFIWTNKLLVTKRRLTDNLRLNDSLRINMVEISFLFSPFLLLFLFLLHPGRMFGKQRVN